MGRINGESISGIALAFLAILFIAAAQFNPVWAVVLPADYVLLAVGIALIGLGMWTARNDSKKPSVEHHH